MVDGLISDVKIEVDKRIPLGTFKKYLEQYVQVPSPYFKLCTDSFVQGVSEWSPGMNVNSLGCIEDGATLHVRLDRPSKPGTIRGRLYRLDFKTIKVSFSSDIIGTLLK